MDVLRRVALLGQVDVHIGAAVVLLPGGLEHVVLIVELVAVLFHHRDRAVPLRAGRRRPRVLVSSKLVIHLPEKKMLLARRTAVMGSMGSVISSGIRPWGRLVRPLVHIILHGRVRKVRDRRVGKEALLGKKGEVRDERIVVCR